jgi:hypothetical protein
VSVRNSSNHFPTNLFSSYRKRRELLQKAFDSFFSADNLAWHRRCLCRKKKPSNVLRKTLVKENHPVRKRVNLCARKWTIFAKANMVRVPQNRLSR